MHQWFIHQEFTHCSMSTYYVPGAEKKEAKGLPQASYSMRRPTPYSFTKSSLPIKAQFQSGPSPVESLHWCTYPMILCLLPSERLWFWPFLSLSQKPQTPCLCNLFFWACVCIYIYLITVYFLFKVQHILYSLPKLYHPLLFYCHCFLYFCFLPVPKGIWVFTLWKRSINVSNSLFLRALRILHASWMTHESKFYLNRFSKSNTFYQENLYYNNNNNN